MLGAAAAKRGARALAELCHRLSPPSPLPAMLTCGSHPGGRHVHSTPPREQAAAEGVRPAASPPPFQPPAAASRKIYAACILQRLPVVQPQPGRWQQHWWDVNYRVQEQMLKQYREDLLMANVLTKEAQDAGLVFETNPLVTPLEEDRGQLYRKLDQSVYLVARRKEARADRKMYLAQQTRSPDKAVKLLQGQSTGPASEEDGGQQQLAPGSPTAAQLQRAVASEWEFPEVQHKAGETIRQTAERALASISHVPPSEQQMYFVGNAPCAHYQLTPGHFGDAVFFCKAQLLSGKVDILKGGEYTELAWVTREEAQKLLGGYGLLWNTLKFVL